jgi:hypothetical protein
MEQQSEMVSGFIGCGDTAGKSIRNGFTFLFCSFYNSLVKQMTREGLF